VNEPVSAIATKVLSWSMSSRCIARLLINKLDNTDIKQSFQVMNQEEYGHPVPWTYRDAGPRGSNRAPGDREAERLRFAEPAGLSPSQQGEVMAHSVSPVLHSSRPTFLGRVAGLAMTSVIRFAKAIRHRAEVRQLADFDDHMLEDIGLTRGEVDGALDQSIFENPSVLLVRSFERRQRSQPMAEALRSGRPQVRCVAVARRD
jgi:uncharacterized protein YjiS (DUF1127 family)